MNNYLDELRKISKNNDTSNILIVISPTKIKNTHGATKVIEAPNNQYILQYSDKNKKDKALISLKKDKNILSVEENRQYSLTEINNSNNKSYNSWGIEKMGLDSAINSIDTNRVKDVTVAILDSGCDVDLINKYYKDKIKETYSVYDYNSDVMYDNNGHGTHIAGTIAEGTPSNVKILPVKHTDYMSIETIQIIAGINWIVYNEKADIINMSFGGGSSQSLYQAIEGARQKNIICVAAAGNENTSIPSFPAAYDNTISIASVDSSLNKSDFSNYGSKITFTAPGTAIKSLMGNYTQLSKNNGNNDDDDHEIIGGTSMATPHAVCAVALLKSFNKDLSLDNVVELLKKNTIDLGKDGFDQIYGYGFINFSNAKFCDGNDCDSYNVFKTESNKMITKLDIGTDTYESLYNYGNNTNLLDMQIKIYYSKDEYVTKDLGELENLEIENYDPYLEGEQTVTIKYNDFTLTKKVMNHLDDGWVYQAYNDFDNSIDIKGFKDENNYPKYVEVPKTYKNYKIGNLSYSTFDEKEKLKQVKILADIEYIESSTFSSCINLETVILPKTIRSIQMYAFNYTPKLYNIDLPESIQEIGENAFNESGISSITIPGGVKKIEEGTFSNTPNLQTVNIESGVSEISREAFYNSSNLETIHIPSTVTKIEENAFGKDISLKNITIDNANEFYESEEYSGTIVDKKTNILIMASEESIIPEKVKVVGPYSISSSSGYKIPEGITELKDAALLNCASGVLLPNSLTKIESANVFPQDEYYVIFVHNQSYAHNFLHENNIKYNIIETEKIEINTENKKYKAFDKINEELTSINVSYEGTAGSFDFISNNFSKQYKIIYENGKDSLRYGDTYFTIVFDTNYSKNHYEERVNVEVKKAIPEYTLPSDLKAKIGNKLSTINLPNGFHWNNPDEIVTGTGIKKYLANYVPVDKDNYETIENIELEVLIESDKQVIIPDISINNKIFDGTTYINPEDLTISNLNSNEYIIEQLYTKETTIGKTKAIIHLKLTDEKFLNYSFDDGSQEKEFETDIEILPRNLKKPTLSNKLYVYNGKEQKAILNNYIEDYMDISGNTRTNAGSQNIIISLKDKNYIWEDNTNDDISLTFTIEKATPQINYHISKSVVKYDAQLHNINITVNSPSNVKIKYMNNEGAYILDDCPSYQEIGDYLIKYKLYIENDNNYNEIYEERKLSIKDKIIDYYSNNYEGFYDGKKHTIDLKLNSNDYNIKYSINNLAYDLTSIPEFSEVGEYIINYKISSPDFDDIEESGKVTIYGIKKFDSSLSVNENSITTSSNSFNDLVNKIDIFSTSSVFTHLNSKGEITNSDLITNGDILLININNTDNIKYNILLSKNENKGNYNKIIKQNVVVGDTTKNIPILKYILGIILIGFGLSIMTKCLATKN